MSNLWYCEENGEAVGPLTLAELSTRLSQAANANSVPVWREGMADWQSAGGLPELVALIAKRPPPLRVRSPPPSSDPIKPSNNESDKTSSPKSKSKGAPFWYSLIIIALFAGGLRFLNEVTRTTPSVDLTKQILGNVRKAFVKEGLASCLKKQESDPDTKSLSFSREKLVSYCSCYMNSLADVITYGDLNAGLPKDGSIPPWMQSKIASLGNACTEKLHKGLLGG